MARYIKANPKVVSYLHLENVRNQLQDGNYLLWQADILEFGSLTQLPDILAQIGGIALSSHEAREEQDGVVLRPLPEATDPRFIYTTPQPEPEPEPQPEGENAPQGDAEPSDEPEQGGEAESPSAAQETPAEGEEGGDPGEGDGGEHENGEED